MFWIDGVEFGVIQEVFDVQEVVSETTCTAYSLKQVAKSLIFWGNGVTNVAFLFM